MYRINSTSNWMDEVLDQLGEEVYLTIDLDVFDPSIMPSTGTPEPGGLYWYDVITLVRRVIEEKTLVGFDVVELAPVEGVPAPDFMAAKLVYKIDRKSTRLNSSHVRISYAVFCLKKKTKKFNNIQ